MLSYFQKMLTVYKNEVIKTAQKMTNNKKPVGIKYITKV